MNMPIFYVTEKELRELEKRLMSELKQLSIELGNDIKYLNNIIGTLQKTISILQDETRKNASS